MAVKAENVPESFSFHQDKRKAVGIRDSLIGELFHHGKSRDQVLFAGRQPYDAHRQRIMPPISSPRIGGPTRQERGRFIQNMLGRE